MIPTNITRAATIALLALGVAAMPAHAEKPEWAGKGKGHGKGVSESKGKSRQAGHFRGEQQAAVRDYYAAEFRNGRCPPGLAKKQNGCMPPGQAGKHWKVGEPLPGYADRHAVPPQLIAKIGPPPAGYEYVRVASDILMIAVGTRMVVDAINDLGRI
jgi:Ni/Co efflux regulator RcnB